MTAAVSRSVEQARRLSHLEKGLIFRVFILDFYKKTVAKFYNLFYNRNVDKYLGGNMLGATKIAEALIPVTQFNRGQTSKIFEKLNKTPSLIVLKNNKPTAFILSPKEYERLSEIEENYYLLQEAVERLSRNQKTFSHEELLAELGLTQDEIDSAEDVEIE